MIDINIAIKFDDVQKISDVEFDSLKLPVAIETWKFIGTIITYVIYEKRNSTDEVQIDQLNEILQIAIPLSGRFFMSLKARGYFSPAQIVRRRWS